MVPCERLDAVAGSGAAQAPASGTGSKKVKDEESPSKLNPLNPS